MTGRLRRRLLTWLLVVVAAMAGVLMLASLSQPVSAARRSCGSAVAPKVGTRDDDRCDAARRLRRGRVAAGAVALLLLWGDATCVVQMRGQSPKAMSTLKAS